MKPVDLKLRTDALETDGKYVVMTNLVVYFTDEIGLVVVVLNF